MQHPQGPKRPICTIFGRASMATMVMAVNSGRQGGCARSQLDQTLEVSCSHTRLRQQASLTQILKKRYGGTVAEGLNLQPLHAPGNQWSWSNSE